jgi:hypothetical protein
MANENKVEVITESTDLITINTQFEKRETYIALKNEITDICQRIDSFIVDSDNGVTGITELVTLGRQLINRLNDDHDIVKAPVLKRGRTIDKAYSDLSATLKKRVESRVGDAAKKINTYLVAKAEEKRKIDEANARISKEASEKDAEIRAANEKLTEAQTFDEEGTMISGPDLLEPEPAPKLHESFEIATKATTHFGSSAQKLVPEWKVVNFAILPDRFKMEATKILKAAIEDANERDIPGVEIKMVPVVDFKAKALRKG